MAPLDISVLIVEDSPTQAMALRRALEQEHFQVIVATNGVDALAILRTQRPTLVISDIVMPEMDGCEMCRRIKDDSSLADIPVILVTSLSDPQDVIRGLQSGADNFLTKPFDKEVLVERIHNILLNRELRRHGLKTETGMEIFFAGKKHAISVERFQIIDLLLSTFDSAIQQNQKANVALQTEVAERKRAEATLKESENRLNSILAALPTGVVIIDEASHVIVDVNPMASRMVGAPREQIVGNICHSYICPAEKGKCPISDLGQAMDNSERILRRADGSQIPIIKTVMPIVLGGRKHLLENFIDVTRQKNAEMALRAEQDNLTAIFDASPVGMLVLDENFNIVKENAAAISLISRKTEILLDRRLGSAIQCIHSQEDPRGCGYAADCFTCLLRQAVASVFAGGAAIHGKNFAVILSRAGNPQLVWIQVGMARLLFAGRQHVVVALEDVTEQKLANEQLQKWNAHVANELELAGTLQKALLSIKPVLTPMFQADAHYRSSLQVGGDFFDIVPLDGGCLCVYIGDVSGHGVAPAMISSMFKALLPELIRDFAAQGPATICNELHRHFMQLIKDPSLYATFFLAFLDPCGGILHAMNCGHPWPLLLDGKLADMAAFGNCGGVPIGVAGADAIPYAAADETLVVLPPGGAILFYTDGLSEAHRLSGGQMVSETGVRQVFRELLRETGWKAEAGALFKRLEAAGYDLGTDDCSCIRVAIADSADVRFRRTLPCDLTAVSELGETVGESLAAIGWPEIAAQKARLLIVEHCTNIVRHGNCPPGTVIQVQMAVRGHQCRFLSFDSGKEWDFRKSVVPLDQVYETRDHGRGLGIIQALASHIVISRNNNQNGASFVIEWDEE